MAIKKNKTGIMAAITAAAEASNSPSSAETSHRAQRTLPRGTIGAVRVGVGGIQEIDTELILPWGPPDRMELELTTVNKDTVADLVESISKTGQQVPVLLRPSRDRDGHFEVIYGRRRIIACRQLGLPVNALIRTLDDTEALMAKGLENASRKDLSFYERARFAVSILEQGYDRKVTCQALSISKHSLSQLERVTRLVPDVIGDAIGPAYETGRPRWTELAEMFERGDLNESKCLNLLQTLPKKITSDDRIIALLEIASKPKKKRSSASTNISLDDVGKMTIMSNKIGLTLAKQHADSFSRFLQSEMADLVKRYKQGLENK